MHIYTHMYTPNKHMYTHHTHTQIHCIHPMHADGWCPGRTLVLCSQDAEECGLIGSTEFVEDKGKATERGNYGLSQCTLVPDPSL